MADTFIKFYHADSSALNASTLMQDYPNGIIFIKDKQQIWAQGQYFGVSDAQAAQLAKLGKHYPIAGIKTGQTTAYAKAADAVLTINASNGISAEITEDGLVLSLDTSTLATKIELNNKVDSVTATANKGIIVEGTATEPTVGIKIDETTKGNVTLSVGANGLKGEIDLNDYVTSVTGKEAITVTNTKTPEVSLALDNSGNVKFSQSATGLKAEVTIPDASVTGVKSGDKVLKLEGTELTSTLSINYNSASKKVELKGIDGEVISYFDADAFVKDGMIQSAELVTEAESGVTGIDLPYIKLTFNTDSGKANEPIRFSVKKLVDVYDGANLKLSSTYTAASTFTEDNVKATASVDTVVGELVAGVKKAIADASSAKAAADTADAKATSEATEKANAVKTTVDAYTVNGKKISTNPVLTGADVSLGTYTKAGTYAAVAATDTVNVAIGKVEKLAEEAKSAAAEAQAAGVTSFGEATGAISVDTNGTGNGNVQFTIDSSTLKGSVTGLGSAAYTEAGTYATAAQGGKADTALQSISKGTDGSYVTTTVSAKGDGTTQSVGVAVTVQNVSTAGASAKGLAEASDVKNYVEQMFTWVEIGAK